MKFTVTKMKVWHVRIFWLPFKRAANSRGFLAAAFYVLSSTPNGTDAIADGSVSDADRAFEKQSSF